MAKVWVFLNRKYFQPDTTKNLPEKNINGESFIFLEQEIFSARYNTICLIQFVCIQWDSANNF